jgi:enoyl-CoA hydratase/carnithine racemase
MNAPLEAKLSKQVLRQICLFGETVNPKKSLTYQIVDQITESKNLLETTMEIAENQALLGENRLAYGGVKKTLYDQYIKQAEDGSPDDFTKQIVFTMNAKL